MGINILIKLNNEMKGFRLSNGQMGGWHWVAFGAHLVCAIALSVLWSVLESWYIPVTYEYVEWVDEANGTSIQPRMKVLFEFPLLLLSVLFASLTAVSHVLQAIWLQGGLVRWKIEPPSDIGKARDIPNQFRWMEYSVTAVLMICLIDAISGFGSIYAYIWTGALTALTMFLGWLSETLWYHRDDFDSKARSNARSNMLLARTWVIVVAWLSQVAVWVPITVAFFVSVGESDAPAAIKAIAPTLFVFFCLCFGMLHVWPSHADNERYGLTWDARELGYIGLSFGSKVLLNVFIAWGLIVRRRENITVHAHESFSFVEM